MKFLCDVHISYQLSKFFVELGYDSEHVNFILNRWNTSDEKISNYADSNDRILITKDIDFKNSHILSNTPKKLIRIELGNIKNDELIKLFNSRIKLIEQVNFNSSFMLIFSKQNLTQM